METGEVVIEGNSIIDEEAIARIEESGVFSSFDQVEVMTQKDDGTPVKVICSSGNREDNYRTLEICDIIACVDYLLNMMQGYGKSDDIDHLATAASAASVSSCRTSSVSVSPVWKEWFARE